MQQNLFIPSNGIELSAVLHYPLDYVEGKKYPCIAVLHGFGSNKDGANVKVPCELYTRLGYFALRFDMQSCGLSGGEPGMVLCEDQVINTKDVITYLEKRSEINPKKIALSGSSFGGAVAIYTGGDDPRVAAVICAGGWGNGDRKLQGQHPGQEAWTKFKNMLAQGKAYRAERGKPMMVSRFDIVPIPPHLRQGLPSNSVMDFSVDTAQSIFDFMPETKLADLAPRPLLLLHAAIDSVTPTSESIEMFKIAKKPTELHLFDDVEHFMMGEADPRVESVITLWLAKYLPVA
jgi:fermentation-respiration switch protein FrsA (DUF1100 family)